VDVLLQGFSQLLAQSSKLSLGMSLYLWKQRRIHEQFPQEDLEVSSSFPCQHEEEIKESWTISNEEQTLEPEIKEFLASLSLDPDPLCTQEYDDQFSEELHDMTTTRNQGNKDHIEVWFQSVINMQHHSIFQQFLAPFLQKQLASHILVFIKVHFSDLDVSLTKILLCEWMHWKYSYT
jgi:hypothetical protein